MMHGTTNIKQNLNNHLFVYLLKPSAFKSMHEICYSVFTGNVTSILQVVFNDFEAVQNTERYTNLKVSELSVSIAVWLFLKVNLLLWFINMYRRIRGQPLWSSGQSFWLQIQRSRVLFPALPDFMSNSGSGTGSTQPREVNWGATWIKK